MCQIAGVSRSGFYSYMKNRNDKDSHLNRKEEQDKRDFDLILEAYSYKGYDKGSRGIRMRLLHMGADEEISSLLSDQKSQSLQKDNQGS